MGFIIPSLDYLLNNPDFLPSSKLKGPPSERPTTSRHIALPNHLLRYLAEHAPDNYDQPISPLQELRLDLVYRLRQCLYPENRGSITSGVFGDSLIYFIDDDALSKNTEFLQLDNPDHLAILTALAVQRLSKTETATIYTYSQNLSALALSMGINSEAYEPHPYTGFRYYNPATESSPNETELMKGIDHYLPESNHAHMTARRFLKPNGFFTTPSAFEKKGDHLIEAFGSWTKIFRYVSKGSSYTFYPLEDISLHRNGVNITPQNIEQRMLLDLLVYDADRPKPTVVIAEGPANTGKTFLSLISVITDKLRHHELIILPHPLFDLSLNHIYKNQDYIPFRPNNRRGNEVAFGSYIVDAIAPTSRSVVEDLNEYFRSYPLESFVGRKIENNILFLDNFQNYTIPEAKMLFATASTGTRIFILGDQERITRPGLTAENNGLRYAFDHFIRSGRNDAGYIRLSIPYKPE